MLTYNPPRYLFRRHTVLRSLRRGKTFLEIGAGNLKLSSELAKHFDKGTALDFEVDIKSWHKRLPKNLRAKISVEIEDIFRFEPKTQYDCVVSCEVMEHIKDDKKFLVKIHKLLRDGGQVIISVPAKEKYWSVHDEIAGHYRRYDKARLIELLAEVGFKDIKVYSYGFPFINGLRLLRVMHGKRQAKTKLHWSRQKQTKQSGVGQISGKFDILAIVVNPLSFYIPNLISRLFDNMDLSEGYVAVATK
ncbi:hypothetical protein A3F38_01885 [Candidatus Saccharibacteria bacterium RIFCSPHIGHO2_12_FULL_48_21]|nr:MAG: hypothetical protein A3F38_01885 [Candidatus Saccharibacteria bacterium RIFCSPHIGHO2_12_FULL_48_21]